MQQLKNIISDLQNDTIKILQCLSRLSVNTTNSEKEISKGVEEFMCGIENLCVKSRNILSPYEYKQPIGSSLGTVNTPLDIAGNIDITRDGWVKITLNTLLPNCRQRISRYIGDTIGRLIENFPGELPYFETAFMAIVEYCNNRNHIALDNDNKGWKMIPNALKGSIIEDDNQFILSMGLFTKESDDLKCEVYVMPQEEVNIFMELLTNDML